MNANSMYVQYKVNLSENQVDTLKDDIRLKKGVTLCFPKGGIKGNHVLLLHQHKSIDWTRHKWKGDVYKFILVLDKWQRM